MFISSQGKIVSIVAHALSAVNETHFDFVQWNLNLFWLWKYVCLSWQEVKSKRTHYLQHVVIYSFLKQHIFVCVAVKWINKCLVY